METKSILYDLIIAAIPVAITTIVTWHIASRRLIIENIDRERTTWRKEVREIAARIYEAMTAKNKNANKLNNLRNELRIRLNPYYHKKAGKDDCEIIESVCLPTDVDPLENAEEFSFRISLLLKHDWERSKHSAGLNSCKPCEPTRTSYREWLRSVPTRHHPKNLLKRINN